MTSMAAGCSLNTSNTPAPDVMEAGELFGTAAIRHGKVVREARLRLREQMHREMLGVDDQVVHLGVFKVANQHVVAILVPIDESAEA